MDDFLAGIFGFALLGAIIAVPYMFFSGTAVLYWREPWKDSYIGPADQCFYWTPFSRSRLPIAQELYCKRFIKVFEEKYLMPPSP